MTLFARLLIVFFVANSCIAFVGQVVEEVLQKHLNRTVDHERLFGMDAISSLVEELPRDFDHVVWTKPMRR